MDFLECKVCNIPYDEYERRPRTAPCGHEWCSACINQLIEDRHFVCPKCRQKHKVNGCHSLPLNFGLIDAIKAFNSLNITSNMDVCKVHHKIIEHRCLKCKRWLCDICLLSHTELTNCSTINSAVAVKSLKRFSDELLLNCEEGSNDLLTKIHEHLQKIAELKKQSEEHEREIKKIENLLTRVKKQKEKILSSKERLAGTDSPLAVMEGIGVLEEMQQALRTWSITNLGNDFPNNNRLCGIYKALKDNKNAYVEMIINDQKKYAKISQDEDNIYFHTFKAKTLSNDDICLPYANLQKLIPPSSTLVFIELSLGGVVKGYVYLRLIKDQPNILEHMVQLVTGQQDHSLTGITLNDKDIDSIYNLDLPFKEMQVTADSNARCKANRGDVMGLYIHGYLQQISFQIDGYDMTDFKVIGCIESGMDLIQECYDNHSEGVVITDCGLVLEQK